MKRFSRRQFGLGAGAAGALAGVGLPGFAEARPLAQERAFPKGFLWGCATAAYQTEGGAREDGRGPSIWDVFSHMPGKTHDGDTGDVADDFYHRYKEDIQLLKNLGVQTFRMSISWSRVFPTGRGPVNVPGLDYYKRVLDELHVNGITPYVTLFHWDLPAALPGGWQSRDTAKAFADYAAFIAKNLGDRIRCFMTTNEFGSFTDAGYREGLFAPGLKLPAAESNQVRHHAILAHGLGVQAIRANARAGTEVGLAEDAAVFVPVIETPEHIEAAKKATRERNAQFLTAVMEGRYIDSFLKREGADAPKAEAGDMEAIGSKLDFVGLNVYRPSYVRADGSAEGFVVDPLPTSYPHMASPWISIGPECIYWTIRNVSELWKPKGIFITENGCSSDDVPNAEGRIEDIDRVMYLRNHIGHLRRAAQEGFPVKGYFLWSLLDNFEWTDGYSKRFGIHYVDFATQKRTPKLSAEYYKAVIAANAVL
jgi:beta-glucosidase